MLDFVSTALADADVLLYVTDVVETPDKNQFFIDRIQKIKIPVLVIINKVDLSNQEKIETMMSAWKATLPQAEVIPISALLNFNIEKLLNRVTELLPECPPYFPKDQLTDKSERFFVSEIIREKILLNYQKEIPYSVEIVIDEFSEKETLTKIRAIINVIRDSQKGIIIGHKGEALKKTATMARQDIEIFLGRKVFLEVYVKVNKDWRDKPEALKRFGYNLSSLDNV